MLFFNFLYFFEMKKTFDRFYGSNRWKIDNYNNFLLFRKKKEKFVKNFLNLYILEALNIIPYIYICIYRGIFIQKFQQLMKQIIGFKYRMKLYEYDRNNEYNSNQFIVCRCKL